MSFFGSFRVGELLSKSEKFFNTKETLLWSDITFFEDCSIQIHVKIPKSRKENGENVSLFTFPHYNCCPVSALSTLKNSANVNMCNHSPVFVFNNGKALTCKILNKVILKMLHPHIGKDAFFYSCRSFRPAMPSALAALPIAGNEKFIKRCGRWNSEVFERYTRLNHKAKKKIFTKFHQIL